MSGINEWERRSEYYTILQFGKDVKTQTSLLSQATEEMLHHQLKSTNDTIISQERIREGLDDLVYSLERIEQGLYGLQAAFEWGISEIVWQIELNRKTLKNILEVLMAPLDAQAKELRRRAEYAYMNGWFEDALEDFLESERKNRYDFTVHMSIGMIYLFELIDRERAFDYFIKAAKYAKPKSNYFASFALLHAALVMRDLGKIGEALKLTYDAIGIMPEFAEALYQNAQYNAQLNYSSKSILNLRKAIFIDKNYCLRAASDPMFTPIRESVDRLFDDLRRESGELCLESYTHLVNIVNMINQAVLRGQEIFKIEALYESFSFRMERIKQQLDRGSYFDNIEAQFNVEELAKEIERFIENQKRVIKDKAGKLIDSIEHEVRNVPLARIDHIKQRRTKLVESTGKGCLVWIILFYGYGFFGLLILFYMVLHDENLASEGITARTPHFWIFMIGCWIILLGGGEISKWLLYKLSFILYPDETFDEFIKSKEQEKSELYSLKLELLHYLSQIEKNLIRGESKGS